MPNDENKDRLPAGVAVIRLTPQMATALDLVMMSLEGFLDLKLHGDHFSGLCEWIVGQWLRRSVELDHASFRLDKWKPETIAKIRELILADDAETDAVGEGGK